MNTLLCVWSAFLVLPVLSGLWEEGLDRLFVAEQCLEPRFSWLWFRIYHYYYYHDGDFLLFLLMSSSPTPTAPIKIQCTRFCTEYFWYIIHFFFTWHTEEVECSALSTPSCWWSLLRAFHPRTRSLYWPLSSSDSEPRHADFLVLRQTNCYMSVFLFPKL